MSSYDRAIDSICENWISAMENSIDMEKDAIDDAADAFNAFLAEKATPDGMGKMMIELIMKTVVTALPGGFFVSRFWKNATAGLTETSRDATQLAIENGFAFAQQVWNEYHSMPEKKNEGSNNPPSSKTAFLLNFKYAAKKPLFDARHVAEARKRAAVKFVNFAREKQILEDKIEKVTEEMLGPSTNHTPEDYKLLVAGYTYSLFKEYVRNYVTVEVVINTRYGNPVKHHRIHGLDDKEEKIYSLFGQDGNYQRYTYTGGEIINNLMLQVSLEAFRSFYKEKQYNVQNVLDDFNKATRDLKLQAVNNAEDLIKVFGAKKEITRTISGGSPSIHF